MLSGKLPTASLDEPDESGAPVGPATTPTPSNDRRGRPDGQRRSPTRAEPTGAERIERLTAENERLRERVERERERRTAVVKRYERLLDRRDATSRPNGRKHADDSDDSADGGLRALADGLRARVRRGMARLGGIRNAVVRR